MNSHHTEPRCSSSPTAKLVSFIFFVKGQVGLWSYWYLNRQRTWKVVGGPVWVRPPVSYANLFWSLRLSASWGQEVCLSCLPSHSINMILGRHKLINKYFLGGPMYSLQYWNKPEYWFIMFTVRSLIALQSSGRWCRGSCVWGQTDLGLNLLPIFPPNSINLLQIYSTFV